MSAGGAALEAERRGLVGGGYALSAFGLWATIPIYFKAVAHVPAVEVLAHRIVWSVLCVALLLFVMRQWWSVLRAFQHRHTLLALVGSSLLISTNWLIFIWAVASDRLLEASLGYYVTPLVSVLLGSLVLGERLRRLQWIAVVIAALGVVYMLVASGALPWVSLALAFSFGGYGLVRKMTIVGALPGLFIETLIMAPLALAFLFLIGFGGSGMFITEGVSMSLLLMAAGIVTALPLLLYAQAVSRLRLASVGLFQYITPTGQMLIAVLLFGELFTFTHLVTFACIWLALLLYSTSAWRGRATVPPA